MRPVCPGLCLRMNESVQSNEPGILGVNLGVCLKICRYQVSREEVLFFDTIGLGNGRRDVESEE